jgi:hypothetical protein
LVGDPRGTHRGHRRNAGSAETGEEKRGELHCAGDMIWGGMGGWYGCAV